MKKRILALALTLTLVLSFSVQASEPDQQSDYYMGRAETVFSNDHLFYSSNTGIYATLYMARPDGSEAAAIAGNAQSRMVIGPDSNLYFCDMEGNLKCYNVASGTTDILYTTTITNQYGTPEWVEIDFADSTGIQTRHHGYYNISTQTMDTTLEKSRPSIGLSGVSPAPSEYTAVISAQNLKYTKVIQDSDNYIIIGNYVKSGRSSFDLPFDMIGEYVIDKNTKQCVAARTGNPVPDEISRSFEDTSGLYILTRSNALYRIIDGGIYTPVTISEDPNAHISIDTIKGGRLYYRGSEATLNILDIGFGSLPVTPVSIP